MNPVIFFLLIKEPIPNRGIYHAFVTRAFASSWTS
jgi:hypothetical protein